MLATEGLIEQPLWVSCVALTMSAPSPVFPRSLRILALRVRSKGPGAASRAAKKDRGGRRPQRHRRTVPTAGAPLLVPTTGFWILRLTRSISLDGWILSRAVPFCIESGLDWDGQLLGST
jgi:hypothetical protein